MIQFLGIRRVVWFNERKVSFRGTHFKDSKSEMTKFLYVKNITYTVKNNLNKTDDCLLKDISKGTKYEIVRCSKDDEISCSHVTQEAFINLYNKFAVSRSLSQISKRHLDFSPDCILRGAYINQTLVAVHAYTYSKNSSVVRLLFSAADPEQYVTSAARSRMGRINRFFHYEDMLYFKNKGYSCYDFGGFAKDTEDKGLAGINSFKLGFGGYIAAIENYQFRFFKLFR